MAHSGSVVPISIGPPESRSLQLLFHSMLQGGSDKTPSQISNSPEDSVRQKMGEKDGPSLESELQN